MIRPEPGTFAASCGTVSAPAQAASVAPAAPVAARRKKSRRLIVGRLFTLPSYSAEQKIEAFECWPQRALTIDVRSIFLLFSLYRFGHSSERRGALWCKDLLPEPRTENREPIRVARRCLFTNQVRLLFVYAGRDVRGKRRGRNGPGACYAIGTSFEIGGCVVIAGSSGSG